MPIRLHVEGLSAKRGEDLIFHDISFVLESGQALVVTGPNGSGKSTLLRVLAGLLGAESGSVRVDGRGEGLSAEIGHPRELCHYLGHHNAMKRELTVAENLSFWKSFMGDSAGGLGGDVEAATETLGLGGISHLPFGYLSAGQQRRMAMARLLVAYRPIWLLDEPTAALDATAEGLFTGLVADHLGRGGIVVAATHQPLRLEGAAGLSMTGAPNIPVSAV